MSYEASCMMTEVIWTGSAAPEQAVQDATALFEESVADLK